jgi:hypothetical protein
VCDIVLPLPLGKTPFAIKQINNKNKILRAVPFKIGME